MWIATHVCGAMADGRGWCPRVCRWDPEVVGFLVLSAASWMWLVPAYVAVAFGCDWVHTCLPVADGCGSSWRWLEPKCAAAAVGCG